MNNTDTYGKPWEDNELDAIVADYFSMLLLDLTGEPYVKARHSKVLMEKLGRSHRSVEFKHQNISAVLEELGLPWIRGYGPKANYQNAIFDAIDRRLTENHQTISDIASQQQPTVPTMSSVFVEPPVLSADRLTHTRLQRLLRKFDPVQRDRRNRVLGKAGEEFVVQVERRQLEEADRPDLAQKVRWVANDDGDGAGYDVLSFDPHGTERLIEVKTTNGAARTPFFLTRNERELATEQSETWRLYRVHLFANTPRIFTIAPPLDVALLLRPEMWRASFGS